MSRQKTKAVIDWKALVKDLLTNCQLYHSQYYDQVGFNGPSLYFHRRALTASGPEKIESVYAVLTSWGMHRMGKGGAKMNDFEVFEKSIIDCQVHFEELEKARIEHTTEGEFKLINQAFRVLKPMRSNAKIVGVSKVLAHYLPNLIAPVDRQYTFQFLNNKEGKIDFPRNWEEVELLQQIHLQLFKPIACDKDFRKHADRWLEDQINYRWDTSIPKIIDNLIIGKIKIRGWDKELLEA